MCHSCLSRSSMVVLRRLQKACLTSPRLVPWHQPLIQLYPGSSSFQWSPKWTSWNKLKHVETVRLQSCLIPEEVESHSSEPGWRLKQPKLTLQTIKALGNNIQPRSWQFPSPAISTICLGLHQERTCHNLMIWSYDQPAWKQWNTGIGGMQTPIQATRQTKSLKTLFKTGSL